MSDNDRMAAQQALRDIRKGILTKEEAKKTLSPTAYSLLETALSFGARTI